MNKYDDYHRHGGDCEDDNIITKQGWSKGSLERSLPGNLYLFFWNSLDESCFDKSVLVIWPYIVGQIIQTK